MDIKKLIGARIAKARKEAGYTSQADLATACGWGGDTPQSIVSGYETGRRSPSPDRLVKIAQVTGKPIMYFYSDIEQVSDPAAQYITSTKTGNTAEVETLCRVISTVERICHDKRINLSAEQKARAICAILQTERSENSEASTGTIQAVIRAMAL